MDNVMLADKSGELSKKIVDITHNTIQNSHVEFGMPKAKSVPGWEYWTAHRIMIGIVEDWDFRNIKWNLT